jgi:hypothetical protein
MTYETFSDIIKTLQETDRTLDELYARKVDLLDFVDPYHKIINILIKEVYGKEGADWFSWFCYENDFGKKKYEAWDENKNLICQTVKSTWKFLEENYNKIK